MVHGLINYENCRICQSVHSKIKLITVMTVKQTLKMRRIRMLGKSGSKGKSVSPVKWQRSPADS